MPDLLLPPDVVREIQKRKWADQRAEFRARVEQLFDFGDSVCELWNPHLRDLDPLLRMGRARPLAYEPGWGVQPGFYHWVRDNENAAPTVTPITDAGGGFREPDSGVLEDLRRSDLRNPAVFIGLLQQAKAKEVAASADRLAEREERQQEILDRFIAGTRVGVSMNTDTAWTQNHAGRLPKKGN